MTTDTSPESPSSLLGRAASAFAGRAERFDDLPLWLTTMPDAVASPLVEWLRAESEYIRGIRSWKYLPGNTRRAVAFARVVLGEPE